MLSNNAGWILLVVESGIKNGRYQEKQLWFMVMSSLNLPCITDAFHFLHG
jgi:hypothetical protein